MLLKHLSRGGRGQSRAEFCNLRDGIVYISLRRVCTRKSMEPYLLTAFHSPNRFLWRLSTNFSLSLSFYFLPGKTRENRRLYSSAFGRNSSLMNFHRVSVSHFELIRQIKWSPRNFLGISVPIFLTSIARNWGELIMFSIFETSSFRERFFWLINELSFLISNVNDNFSFWVNLTDKMNLISRDFSNI